ncbi:MAG TPA: cupredoxin domain-containing protein [Actinomycetota bacterium]|nr:cupredoxin domain-containing protein [Actinomycetota bacterium]
MLLSRNRLSVVLALAGLVLVAAALRAAAGTVPVQPVEIKYSRFEPNFLRLEAGKAVTFEITNTDPIDHEFILGDRQVQERHETGTEPHHGEIPTEVTVPAGQTVRTTVTFDRPGRLLMACHLPGHYAYGMKAQVVVR